jgi:Concanavalin A-like lectin/glucanases superfamily
MISDANWHNYTVTVDVAANNTSLYFDGILKGTSAYWSPTRSSASDLIIGGAGLNDYGWNWLGGIASFQSYNRALTSSEVTSNFNALKSRFGL